MLTLLVVRKSRKVCVVDMKYPSYMVIENARKEESFIYQVVSLAYNAVELVQENPQQAKTLAKAFMIVGAVGVSIWLVTKLFN